MFTHTHVCKCTHTYANTYTCMHAHTHACTNTHTYIYTHTTHTCSGSSGEPMMSILREASSARSSDWELRSSNRNTRSTSIASTWLLLDRNSPYSSRIILHCFSFSLSLSPQGGSSDRGGVWPSQSFLLDGKQSSVIMPWVLLFFRRLCTSLTASFCLCEQTAWATEMTSALSVSKHLPIWSENNTIWHKVKEKTNVENTAL